jgi:hypothetical protein
VSGKADRLHQALGDIELTADDEALIAGLAKQLPAGDVDRLRSLLTRKGQAGRAKEREVRRRRREDRQTEDHVFADGARRMIRALGQRGGWEALYRLEADVAAAQRVAVERMRADGFSDAEIGAGVGITRQAVRQRFPRQPGVVTGPIGDNALS